MSLGLQYLRGVWRMLAVVAFALLLFVGALVGTIIGILVLPWYVGADNSEAKPKAKWGCRRVR